MPGGEFVKTYGDRGRHTAVTETATVIPRTDGIVYLNVFASGTFNGKKMTSAGAVPINTGTTVRKMLKKSGTGTTDSRGRKLIIMPAEETQPQSK